MSESSNAAVGPSHNSASPLQIPQLVRSYWYLIVIALAFAATFFYWWRYYAFTDQGYAPAQPIAFSHKLHAGEYALDCSYCHFNAEKGKHAGIPPASVCLGCHSPDNGAVGAGLPEVEKMLSIFTADTASSYTTHDLQYFNIEGAPEADPDAIAQEGGVVHWERIHKLPDHVYFSHEWHVAAGVSCQTCHGPVEEMEVVYQYADLTMGWCISCHRNDNYVGGLAYDGQDMETFNVGVGDYDVIRSRIRPDNVVEFKVEIEAARAARNGHESAENADYGDATVSSADDANQSTDQHTGDDCCPQHARSEMRGGFDASKDGAAKDGAVNDEEATLEIVPTMEYFTAAQAQKMERLLEKYPDLPRWRIQDLPETHRAFYGLEGDAMQHLHNAPTHCHTCHQ